MTAALNSGKVILAGAGPGDPGLITVKALRFLEQADVIITDRLVSEELLFKNVKPGASIIHVGKQAGQTGSTSQDVINGLIIKHAKRNKLVVRLKGGDVSFFSNVLDELRTLVEHNIPFEIVPGVTAASGAAAYAGIPLTARTYASAVRFLTFYGATAWEESYWAELAATDDTLVFYMSSDGLDVLVANLLAQGIHDDKSIAVIEQATTPFQNVRLFNFENFKESIAANSFISPTLVIIGRVTALYKEFNWVKNNTGGQSYFKPVKEQIENQFELI